MEELSVSDIAYFVNLANKAVFGNKPIEKMKNIQPIIFTFALRNLFLANSISSKRFILNTLRFITDKLT